MKNPKLYIAISSPQDYYFVTITEDVKTQPPINTNYQNVAIRHLIGQLIEKFPGTIKDLSLALDLNPNTVWLLNRGDYRIEAGLIINCSAEQIRNLINMYYRYILGTGARIPL